MTLTCPHVGAVKANGLDTEQAGSRPRRMKNPFRYFNGSPGVRQKTIYSTVFRVSFVCFPQFYPKTGLH